MKFIIVLGYWLNNDGSAHPELRKRLEYTVEAISRLNPDKIILSGGLATKKAGLSQASVMYNILTNELGVDKDLLILEDKSTTTKENALYSCKILEKYDVEEITILSTLDHFTTQPYNTIKLFTNKIKNKNVRIMIYTRLEDEWNIN